MSEDVRNVLQYFIQHENHARFSNSELKKVDGEQRSANNIQNPSVLFEFINKKKKKAILEKLKQYKDVNENLAKDQDFDLLEHIDQLIQGHMELDAFLDDIPFKHQGNKMNAEKYIKRTVEQDFVTICYPLMMKKSYGKNKEKLLRPLITFLCKFTKEDLEVTSFVLNEGSMEILLGFAEQCPIEEAKKVAKQTWNNLFEAASCIKSTSIDQVIALIDDCLRQHVNNWSLNSLLAFKEYEGWIMLDRLFISMDQFDEINEPIFRAELERLIEWWGNNSSSLLNKYILNNPSACPLQQHERGVEFHYGSYTSDYPINYKQWRIVQEMEQNELLSVNGPPGTGKTTLLKEMIADYTVKKAKKLIEHWNKTWKKQNIGGIREHYMPPFHDQKMYSIVITSTNNDAVDNIGVELLQGVPYFSPSNNDHTDSDNHDSHELAGVFCARLGNSKNIDLFKSKILPILIQGAEQQKIDARQSEHIVTAFEETIDELNQLRSLVKEYWQARETCLDHGDIEELTELEKQMSQMKQEQLGMKKQKTTLDLKIQQLHNKEENLEADHAKQLDWLKTCQSDQQQHEENRRKAYQHKERLKKWKAFPHSLLFFLPTRRDFFRKYPSEDYITDQIIQPLTESVNKCVTEQEHIEKSIEKLSQHIKCIKNEWKNQKDELKQLDQKYSDAQKRFHRLEHLHHLLCEIKKRIPASETSICKMTYYELLSTPEIVAKRKAAFDQALKVLEAYITKYKEEIIFNLKKITEKGKWFSPFYSENNIRLNHYKDGIKSLWETLFLCFPVVTTTLHSFSESNFHPIPGLIDTLFVDEAGQIMPHYLCAPLYRCNKAVIVGDPEQLEPVRTFKLDLLEESSVKESLHNRVCVLKNSAQNFADSGGDIYEHMKEQKKGIILTEHRRCEKSIMAFSNTYVYDEILDLVKKDHHDKLFGSNLVAIDVRGLKDSYAHRNHTEIAACQRIINKLVDKYGSQVKEDIGIITPFTAQREELNKQISGVKAGTVHNFQGQEKKIILFSTVIDGIDPRHAGLTFFIGNHANMLNVAFSRAKEQLIMVGNLEAAKNSKNHLEKAFDTICKHGHIFSIYDTTLENHTDYTAKQESYSVHSDHDGHSNKLKKVNETLVRYINNKLTSRVLLHSKNHYNLLLQAIKYCQNSISIVSPWVSSYVLNSAFFTFIREAQARNSNIKIMFGYKETNFSLDELEKIVNEDNRSYSNKEETILALKKLRNMLKDNLEYKPPLHTKILLIDDQLLFIGSHNWLSNQGGGDREEISTLVTDKHAINYVKERFGI